MLSSFRVACMHGCSNNKEGKIMNLRGSWEYGHGRIWRERGKGSNDVNTVLSYEILKKFK